MLIRRILKSFLSRAPYAHSIKTPTAPKRLFSSDTSAKSEYESIKSALEADTLQKDASSPEGQVKTEKRMLIGFTCKQCQHRTHRTMSHHAYHHGIVLIECAGCQSRHLIADNLGWFKDTPKAAKKIEEMTEVVGEIRKSLKLDENENESRGLVELLKDWIKLIMTVIT